ncbi:hypothetical protein Skr01_36330 [Sphaerisporangium krabiense]|uniref:Uncharacterized protein n=1 Tax=Sphaerisporangium krabiense TaxID=763782 RepID=A0A7W8Z391_9ACTN|nr:hypothetical protein [Sphaerisporangium krabiense]MBB5626626.1 hypothetical protein [Sphaerisporangium krabiense]GII63548.1 hypothetical protein Skr01_36330 [Sphaerisporangium krabiense]
MALSPAGKNIALDALGAAADFVSLHTADPGTTGASEVTGGSYARQAKAWNPASGGNLDDSNAPTFNIPALTTITHFGLWTEATGGTFLGAGPLSSSESYGAAGGTYQLADVDVSLT